MPFIPHNGRKKSSSRWLESRKGGKRLPLGESLQGNQLNTALRLLRSALDNCDQEHAEAAAGALSELPQPDKEKALREINSILDGTSTEAVRDIKEAQTLSFVLMHLNKEGWSELDTWKDTRPLLERRSMALASSLTLGSMNGTELIALETLGFFASCGAHSYDADTLKRFLGRFIERFDTFPEYYFLTGFLAKKGPEELSSAADEMEEKRIESCISRLDFADDRQFEAAIELVMLLKADRQYLLPQVEEVRDEMLYIMQNPDIAWEEYEDEDDAAEEAERVKQAEKHMRSRAAEVLGLIQGIGIPISLKVDGDNEKELEKAEKLFTRLATHGVALHLDIEGGDPAAIRESLARVPSEYVGLEEDAGQAEMPDIGGLLEEGMEPIHYNQNVAMVLLQMALYPPGETEEEMEANRADSISRLKDLQDNGVPLGLGVGCPPDSNPEEQASGISEMLDLFQQNGLDVRIELADENAAAVKQLLGENSPVTEAKPGEYMSPEEVDTLLQTALFPQGESQEEEEAMRAEAINRLKPLQETGFELNVTVVCTAENDPETLATMLGLSLDIMEMNGLYPVISLTGENAQDVAYYMNTEE